MATENLKHETCFEEYFSNKQEFYNLDLTLDRVDKALSHIIKEIQSVIIHVAGTNGKGSTSSFISQILENEGYSTLLFTSPHIDTIRERIQFRGEIIPPEIFDSLFIEAKPIIEESDLSYFEAIFFIAMLYAKNVQPNFIVLETGLGGRYDATNSSVIDKKIPVITTIAQDHEKILGYKVEDILLNKLDIAKNSDVVFIGHNEPFINKMIEDQLKGKVLYFLPDELPLEIEKAYNKPFTYNYFNAERVVEFILGKKITLKKLSLPPCRQEKIGRVLLDGAHNMSGLVSLFNSMNDLPEAIILSTTSDRDIKKLYRYVLTKVPKVFLTVIPDNSRSYSLEHLKSLGSKVFEKPEEALKYALSNVDGDVLVAGSLYLCAYLRSKLIGGLCQD